MMKPNKKTMIDKDITNRLEKEEKYVKDPPEKKESTGRATNIITSVGIALVVLIGLLIPLFSLF